MCNYSIHIFEFEFVFPAQVLKRLTFVRWTSEMKTARIAGYRAVKFTFQTSCCAVFHLFFDYIKSQTHQLISCICMSHNCVNMQKLLLFYSMLSVAHTNQQTWRFFYIFVFIRNRFVRRDSKRKQNVEMIVAVQTNKWPTNRERQKEMEKQEKIERKATKNATDHTVQRPWKMRMKTKSKNRNKNEIHIHTCVAYVRRCYDHHSSIAIVFYMVSKYARLRSLPMIWNKNMRFIPWG